MNTGIRIAISSLSCIAQLETETQNRKYLHILLTAFDCSCLEEYHFMVRIELIFICYTLHFKYCVLLTNIKIKEASVELVWLKTPCDVVVLVVVGVGVGYAHVSTCVIRMKMLVTRPATFRYGRQGVFSCHLSCELITLSHCPSLFI